jgi:hypothetical protein
MSSSGSIFICNLTVELGGAHADVWGLALYPSRVRSSDLLGGRPLHFRVMHFPSQRVCKPCAEN